MTCPNWRYYVALVDRLPAGLEPINFALKNAVTVNERESASAPKEMNRWADHQNIRDNQVEAFANELWPGTYNFTYFASAVTTGTFTAAPATAEEMYSPEIQGRTSAVEVVID